MDAIKLICTSFQQILAEILEGYYGVKCKPYTDYICDIALNYYLVQDNNEYCDWTDDDKCDITVFASRLDATSQCSLRTFIKTCSITVTDNTPVIDLNVFNIVELPS